MVSSADAGGRPRRRSGTADSASSAGGGSPSAAFAFASASASTTAGSGGSGPPGPTHIHTHTHTAPSAAAASPMASSRGHAVSAAGAAAVAGVADSEGRFVWAVRMHGGAGGGELFRSAGPRASPELPLEVARREQRQVLDTLADAFDVDTLATLGFHDPGDIRGLVATEPSRVTALCTVPVSSTLAVLVADDGDTLSIVAPPEMPPNVKRAIELVAGLVKETQDYQLLILAVLLLWARKYGSEAWQRYCDALLPPHAELSCLLTYAPGELPQLQLPHLVEEAARQHDWARWVHSQWTSSASGALRRLGLAEGPEDTAWALAVVRSRAVEFPLGLAAAAPSSSSSGNGSGSSSASGSGTAALGSGAGGDGGAVRGPVLCVLAPVLDLANHSPDPNCVLQLTTDRSKVVLLPRRPVAAGEPLTVDYGYNRSNLDLMVDYGFVTPANPRDGYVDLPGCDKLPPLEVRRLEAAAAALRRRWRRASQGRDWAAAGDGGGRDAERDAEMEVEVEVEGSGGELVLAGGGADTATAGGQADGDGEAARRERRLRAAVALLSPRSSLSPGAPGTYSTPATQRIVGGLWHKLVRHCMGSLPTNLDTDRILLYDIEAGRVSGSAAGIPFELDPGAPKELEEEAEPAPARTPSDPDPEPEAKPASDPHPAPAADPKPAPVAAAAAAAKKAPARKPPPVKRRSLAAAVAEAEARTSAAMAAARAKAAAGKEAAPGGSGAETKAGTESTPAPEPPATSLGSGSEAESAPSPSPAPAPPHAASSALAADPSSQPQPTAASPSPSPASSPPQPPCETSASAPDAPPDSSTPPRPPPPAPERCRSGRRVGRLYAAVVARMEHKELLAVAEELLLEYAR
ncbi:hypothetical protein HYH03_004475 [Edaphochlamys debaryana]|uniref:SET domain-containing protein n=1 Tax=Edaphochlamys debaryana TaxID=47281 RepID=A0A836C3F0_9CHLO|nr:hypothetical protein HYH03_004475 [Edaphochlamys debaryana]|eukprot:KAG2497742.1 hypothetical protein HYH03_004475 [Edaphochlamys debaryana]